MSEQVTISEEQKEVCATLVLRTMLTDYCYSNNLDFDKELLKIAGSNTYACLYDYSTGLWKEGPDYLLNFYQDEQSIHEGI